MAVFAAVSAETLTEPIYTVTLETSASNAFTDAGISITKTLGGVTAASSYAEFYAETGGGTLVKTGGGWLTIDSPLSNWTGQIHVDEGYLAAICANALGKADIASPSRDVIPDDASGVFVHSGATLVMDASFDPADNEVVENKRITIAGAGADGRGALISKYYPAGSGSSSMAWPGGSHLTLSADALVGLDMKKPLNVKYNTYHLNGHQLTFRKIAASSTVSLNSSRLESGSVIFDGVSPHFRNSIFFKDDPAVVVSNANLTIASVSSVSGTCRLHLAEGVKVMDLRDAVKDIGWYSMETNHLTWCGEMVVDEVVTLRQSAGRRNPFIVRSAISGTGGFTDSAIENSGIDMHLMNSGNTFLGGIALSNARLYAHSSGAIPAAGGAVAVTNSQVFLTALDGYNLPALEFGGTGTLVSAGADIVHGPVVKTGEGELKLYTAVTGSVLDVRGGGVKFPYGKGGMYGSQSTIDLTEYNTLKPIIRSGTPPAYTNFFGTLAEHACVPPSWHQTSGSGGWIPKGSYITYECVVWNRSGTNEMWTFAGNPSKNLLAALFIDGARKWTRQGSDTIPTLVNNVLIGPGPHTARMHLLVSPSYGGLGPEGCTNETWTWAAGYGFAYDPCGRGSHNSDDYLRFEEDGEGVRITRSADAEENALYFPHFNKMCFRPGTYLNLNSHDCTIADLEGLPTVTNGSFAVTNSWKLVREDIVSGTPANFSGGVSFAPGVKLYVMDLDDVSHSRDGELFTLAKFPSGMSGMPALNATSQSAAKWRLEYDAGASALLLRYHPLGLVIEVR